MNLLNLLKYQLGSKLTEQLGTYLGEDSSKVQSALDATLPTILSVFVRRAADRTGANDVMDTIKLGNHDGSMLNYLSGLFSGGSSTNSLMKSGEILSNKFLGNKQSLLSDAIANFSGIKRISANSLIKMAMPLVLGIIGKQVKNQNLDTSGLMSLLSAQKGHIGASIPSGFTTKNMSPSTPTPKVTPTPEKKKTINESISKEQVKQANVKTPPKKVAKKTNDSPSFLRFLPFIIGGLLLLFLLIFAIRSCSKSKDTTTTKPKATTKVAEGKKNGSDTKNVADTDAPNADNGSNSDNGSSNSGSSDYSSDDNSSSYTPSAPSIPHGQFKGEVEGITGGGSIAMSGLDFRGGARISRGSRHIISELAAVMQSNPGMNIRLDASPETRAISVKKGLMDAGIDRNRISTSSGGSSTVQLTVN